MHVKIVQTFFFLSECLSECLSEYVSGFPSDFLSECLSDCTIAVRILSPSLLQHRLCIEVLVFDERDILFFTHREFNHGLSAGRIHIPINNNHPE